MILYAIVKLDLEIKPEGGMSEQVACSEFGQETTYHFSSTDNINVLNMELIEITEKEPI
jgi:hypothetical protein